MFEAREDAQPQKQVLQLPTRDAENLRRMRTCRLFHRLARNSPDVVITQLENFIRHAFLARSQISRRNDLVTQQGAPGMHGKRTGGGDAIANAQLAELAPALHRHERMLSGGHDAVP